jgi:pyruvate/2-oxoglutarate dehydrogenase complex dihydrolipoamide acyltransferase (E2) component
MLKQKQLSCSKRDSDQMADIILPELGEGISKATIACWHAKVGDRLKEGQEVCEAVTDKASFVIEAPSSGRLKCIFFDEGQEATVGGVLGTIE